jgi:hypothetical protein
MAYQKGVQDTIRSPADTTIHMYPVPVPVYVPTIDLGHLQATMSQVPMPSGESWTAAMADTVIGKSHVKVEYLSPLPLSPAGYFSIHIDQIGPPDTIYVNVPRPEIIRYVEVTKGPGWQTYGLCILGGVAVEIVISDLIRQVR